MKPFKTSRVFPVIFISSFSTLGYEILLTRVFSISLSYHFAYMIISIAMLGIGGSGTAMSIWPDLRRLSNIRIYTMLLGMSISMSYLIANQIPFEPVKLTWSKLPILYISLYYVTLTVPFFFGGMIIVSAFYSVSEASGKIYASDLIGAGTGALAILFIMNLLSPERSVFMLSCVALSGTILSGGKRWKAVSIILILINLFILYIRPDFTEVRMSRFKGLKVALRYPGARHLETYYNTYSRIDTFKSPAVRFAPGLSLNYIDPLPEQTGISIDGQDINAITAFNKREDLSFVKYLPSALPYEIGGRDDVVILDPRGGLQVLVARYYDARNIKSVESVPLLLRVIRDEISDLSNNIYRKDTWTGLGRSWLRSDGNKFDIIDISLMGSVPLKSFGISEDYRFTVEAFDDYIEHLKPEGIISINLFILPPPRTELRLLNTIVASMKDKGIVDPHRYIAAIRSLTSICILAKRSPFTLREINNIREFARNRGFDLIYHTGIIENETNIYIKTPKNEYYNAFKSLLDSEKGELFIDKYLFDIRAVYDDAPFFSHHLKLKNIKEIYRVMGGKWQYFIEEGYILVAIFVQVFFISLILIILPAFKRIGSHREYLSEKSKAQKLKSKVFIYFALLGLGFMFIEIALIQRFILPLENPPHAVAIVLVSILIGSGMGSLLSHRFMYLRHPAILLVLSTVIIFYSLFVSIISNVISPYSMLIKPLLVFLIILPAALFMGIPFPMGLKILGERDESLIPWAWAINGCLSVLAPIITTMLAITAGFKAVLWLGAIAYLIAFFILRRFTPYHATGRISLK